MGETLKKTVIPAAGIGTRLLPITKEMPKEMLPLFMKNAEGKVRMKPVLQAIFEQLYDFGFREFCFIVGRGKRAIEDHFTPNHGFMNYLQGRLDPNLTEELEMFYDKIRRSTTIFINQPDPKGFGDAVLKARPFTDNSPFLVHAGDDLIFSKEGRHLQRLINTFKSFNAEATLLVEKVEDPRRYGVVVGEKVEPGIFKVREVVEKPADPPSNMATVAVYCFNPKIYPAILKTEPDERNEIQLTNAIQHLIDRGGNVYAVELRNDEKRIDIGTPSSYWKALMETHNLQVL